MGLSEIAEQMSYYPTLTREERARMHPCKKAKCVMTDTSPSLPSLQSPNYVELPDEPRPGKITPTTPSSTTTNSSPSPRGGGANNPHRSNGKSSSPSEATNNTGATATADEEEAIEEAVPIVRTTLPSPEPRPLVERNGYGKEHDKVDSGLGNGLKAKPYPAQRDVDEDSCLIKCVYFTQQCCECTIV